MTTVKELLCWLNSLHTTDLVYVDDGGLTLRSFEDPDVYYEVGGCPLPEDLAEEEITTESKVS